MSTNKHRRIQRKRTKGWSMPPNAVYVGRGSKWGNPFKVVKFHGFNGWCYQIRDTRPGHDDTWTGYTTKREAQHIAVKLYRQWCLYREYPELEGRDLACWCALDEECHADVLLELVNQ